MSRTLYESLFDPDEAEKMGEDAAWLAALTGAAADLRAWRAEGLAAAEFEDGLWVEETPDAAAPVRLAASDAVERDWPVTYTAGPWTAILSLDARGVPYVVLTDGPDVATLRIGPAQVDLEAGEEAPLPDLDAPPASITLTDEEGQQIVLAPVS